MKAYGYTAYTIDGRRRSGTVVAETEAHASSLLRTRGLFPADLAETRPRMGRLRWRRRLGTDLRVVFTRQMAVLLGAGLTADAALDAIRSTGGGRALDAVVAQLRASLMQGLPLSDALERADAGFPRYYLASVRASEMTGDAASVFGALADHLEAVGQDRAKLSTALVYPAFVASVSILLCAVLLTTVAPEIVGMFEISGQPLPPLTEAVLALSTLLQVRGLVMLAALVGAVLLVMLALRLPAVRDMRDGIFLRLPVAGRLIRSAAGVQYLRTLALLLRARHAVPSAVQASAEVLLMPRHRREAAAVAEEVRKGRSLSDALGALSVVPPVAHQLIAAGERSARLETMAERAAVLMENGLSADRKRLAALLEPMLMIVVGGMVLVIILAILLPIFDLQAAVAPLG